MFSLFKSKASKNADMTFKARVDSFWEWYAEVAPRFFQTIEAKQGASLAGEVSQKMDSLFPGMAWVFGPGEGGHGHSFTLSGEGVLHRQLLTQYWQSRAPSLPGWTFYSARQPGRVEEIRMEIGGRSFDPRELWLTPAVNQDRQKIDITAWHPLFVGMDRKACLSPLFLLLDEALGEFGTEQWIGEIKVDDQKFADALPLAELPAFTKKLEAETGWKKLPPGQAAVGYRLQQPHQRFLRGDIITGTTVHPRLLNEYLVAEGELSDPLAGSGADYVFVAFDMRILPKGQQVAVRGGIEDALDDNLRRNHSGRLLGGAFGVENAYIDLLLFDGEQSVEIVRRVLQEQNLPTGTAIHYFAKEKRGHRVVI